MKPLTQRQREALTEIARFHQVHGIMPTAKELGERMSIKTTAAYQHVMALAEKGYIRKGEGWRDITLRNLSESIA